MRPFSFLGSEQSGADPNPPKPFVLSLSKERSFFLASCDAARRKEQSFDKLRTNGCGERVALDNILSLMLHITQQSANCAVTVAKQD